MICLLWVLWPVRKSRRSALTRRTGIIPPVDRRSCTRGIQVPPAPAGFPRRALRRSASSIMAHQLPLTSTVAALLGYARTAFGGEPRIPLSLVDQSHAKRPSPCDRPKRKTIKLLAGLAESLWPRLSRCPGNPPTAASWFGALSGTWSGCRQCPAHQAPSGQADARSPRA